jgi:hypothetical protein
MRNDQDIATTTMTVRKFPYHHFGCKYFNVICGNIDINAITYVSLCLVLQ